MKYIYQGTVVEVVRFTSGETAQLADGTWVASGLLAPVQEKNEATQAMIEAVKRTKRGENN